MEHKFSKTSRDKVLEQILNVCGELSSFSDACSSIVLTHFETIYSHLQNNLNADNVCHLSGQCSSKFHIHEDETGKVNLHGTTSLTNFPMYMILLAYRLQKLKSVLYPVLVWLKSMTTCPANFVNNLLDI